MLGESYPLELGLEVRGVSKSFGSRVLDDVTFSLGKGTIGAIVGPSGAGKTTLLNIISGFTSADKGTVSINGRLVERAGEAPLRLAPIEREVGYVFQDYVLFPHMTIFDNIAFGLRAHHVPEGSVRTRVSDIMRMVGVQELRERRPNQISGGQMQRVAFARALVLEPKLLLLDEPLSALDAQTRETLRFELRSIFESLGTTVVYVTHDLDEAFFLGQQIGIILSGRLVFFGSKRDLHTRMTRATAEFLGFNIIRAEPRRFEGAKCVFFLPEVDVEVALAVPDSSRISFGRPATIAVPPESVEIATSNDRGGTGGLVVQDIMEFKESVDVVLGNSECRLIGRIPDVEFHRLGLHRGQKARVSLASSFLLSE
jgi:ABC-type Fe3+/spermidine/putrescine transport system ATPase subunit